MTNKSAESSFFIHTKDNKKIFIYCWDDVISPKGVIQIVHGMAEHAGRYEEFAKFLNSHGFIVYAGDHRGHGKTDELNLGYIGRDGFNKVVEDQHVLLSSIKSKYSNLPIIFFAHSFGSFIGQEYIIRYGNELSGIILSGSAMRKGIDVDAGIVISYFQKNIFGERKESKLLDFLSFYNYNKKIKNSASKFSWLTTDELEIKNYENDPLCGNTATCGFYYYFLRGLKNLYRTNRLKEIPKDLPILIISGDDDPVGNYGKWVRKLYNLYKNLQLENVNIKLYPGKRHELTNETDKKEIFLNLLNWAEKNCL
ncbi:alpha/beta hydrolase [Clostridium folliculivorans]|uniref:Alpha/beta hydrolase n=1 Tax=Clostridium folliculivorans TaxID=2886038 RepID=A0A9W6D873_9CLOT|nr:alpha/beta hydrolase [Clostridium folliculivorans]GKU23490.1 alpha/beta hydrolase [Clostridium folliculivorans]GKU29606.1 alpha/beta hydrolase [Clostridium folliculivorans]